VIKLYTAREQVTPGDRVMDDTGTLVHRGYVVCLALSDPDRVWVRWDRPRETYGVGEVTQTMILWRELEVGDDQ
jgi:hypothetical protein